MAAIIDPVHGGFGFSLESVGGIWHWTARANNIQGLGQLFEVADIASPFGKLSDINVPIPGEVITAMSGSIEQLAQQFAPKILILSPVSTSLTVTEGDSIVITDPIIVNNAGAFGSFLSASASADVPWLVASPPQILGLGKGQSGQFETRVDPSQLSAASSPAIGMVAVQDINNPVSTELVKFTVTVLPRPEIGVIPQSIILSADLSQASFSTAILTVSNTGPVTSILNFTVAKVSNTSLWLNFTPEFGGPLFTGEFVQISLSVIPAKVPQFNGTYEDKLRVFSSNASNGFIDVPISLVVTGGIG